MILQPLQGRGLVDRIALVTGAGRNLGRAIALALADAGAQIAVNVRSNVAEAEEVVGTIRARGGVAIAVVGDVADPEVDRRLVNQVTDALGPVDCLVHSAAARPKQSFLSITIEEWDRVIRSNMSASFYLSRLVLPHMIESGWGRVINLGGADGEVRARDRAHNVAAKAGIVGLTRSIAVEFGSHGVTSNVVVPGLMDTSRNPRDYPDWPPPQAFLDERLSVPRLGVADEVAAMCAFLASDQAAYITGQTIHVNGGFYVG